MKNPQIGRAIARVEASEPTLDTIGKLARLKSLLTVNNTDCENYVNGDHPKCRIDNLSCDGVCTKFVPRS